MRRDALKLGRRTRVVFYLGFGALFVSGAVWLGLHTFLQPDTGFGPAPHPAEPWLLRLHGAAAMFVLVILGLMIPLHVHRGWRAGRNRRTGGTMVAVCGALIVTGYALYYASGDDVRRIAAWTHNALGLGFPLFLIWHIRRGRRAHPSHPAAKPGSATGT